MLFVFIFLGVGISLVADVFLKNGNVFVGSLCYALVAIPAMAAFKRTSFGNLSIVWSVALVVGGIAVALIVFREPLTRNRILALLFSIVAIWLSNS